MKKLALLLGLVFLLALPLASARAGGGCFPAGTPISTPTGSIVIEKLSAEDSVLAFDGSALVEAKVLKVFVIGSDGYFEIRTEHGLARATGEHPFLTDDGFVNAEQLAVGDTVYLYQNGKISEEKVLEKNFIQAQAPVYNIEVEAPNTFIANGFIVHNKGGGGGFGGGGFGGHYGGSSSGGGLIFFYFLLIVGLTYALMKYVIRPPFKYYAIHFRKESKANWSMSWLQLLALFFLFLGLLLLTAVSGSLVILIISPVILVSMISFLCGFIASLFKGGKLEFAGGSYGVSTPGKGWAALDKYESKGKVDVKGGRANRLLSFLSETDKMWNEKKMKQMVSTTFAKVQEAWENRDYSSAKGLMMDALYQQHASQVAAMVKRHEKNELRNLCVREVQVVLVKNYADNQKDEFTAWISAHAQDVIVDDRTEDIIRGDPDVEPFEEYWTFQRQGNQWKLREIDQVGEKDFISEESYDEESTPEQMKWYYSKDRTF